MHCAPLWNFDSTKILTRRELATVLASLKAKAERRVNVRRNLDIVRLACCCGLRVSEIGGLQLDDLILDVARPHMRLRRETTKGKKARCVSLWWDAGTLADFVAWKAECIAQGARGRDPFVCSVQANRRGLRRRQIELASERQIIVAPTLSSMELATARAENVASDAARKDTKEGAESFPQNNNPKSDSPSDGTFDPDEFRYCGISVRFGRAAKQRRLVCALWCNGKPIAPI